MSTAYHQTDLSAISKRFANRYKPAIAWPKPLSGALPEASIYATIFVWIGAQHDFGVASIIATVLAGFCWFLPR